MGKRLLSAFLCLCMVLCMCPRGLGEEMEEEIPEEEAISAQNDLMDPGEIGNGLSWTLAEDGVLTVSGAGGIPNYTEGAAPWASRAEEILSVMLGENVTAIGSFAFSGCENMDTVHMGQNVSRIGEGAFRNCAGLKGITLPDGLSRIEGNTFENCTGLSYISIPESVSEIGSSAFAGCKGLQEITVPAGVTALANNTFQGCTGLKQVTLPQNLTKIGDCALEGCKSLKEIRLPETVETIGGAAFQNCMELQEITLPQDLRTIGTGAFRNCGLGTVAIPDGVTEIPAGVFEGCTALSRVALPKGLMCLGDSAFRGCGSLTQVEIPEGVTQIGTAAFYGCTDLERVTLPEGLERIEEMLFSGCGALETLVLPETVTSVGNQAFFHCGKLKLAALPKAIQTIEAAAFEGCGDCGFLDLSGLPDTVDRETELHGALPEVLSGRAVTWSIETVPGQKEGRRIGRIRQENGEAFLTPLSAGILRLVCREPVTGARNSRDIQVLAGLEIRPREEVKVVSGRRIQLTLVESASGKEQKAEWFLEGEGSQAAEITQDGLLTAKPVEKQTQVTVMATVSSGDRVQKTVTILPRVTGAALLRDGEPVGTKMRVDMAEERTFLLSVKIQPEDALTEVTWGSGDDRVAFVEDGKVTLLKPGTVTLWASCNDGSNVSCKTTLEVCYIDAAPELTLTCDRETLKPGETVRLQLRGEGPIAPEKVLFFPSDPEKAEIDADGKLTAGDTPGKVTVTAQLKDDPLLRRAQLELEIQEGEMKMLRLVPVFPDDRGYWAEAACVEFGRLEGKAYTFRLTVQGSAGSDRWQELQGADFGSSDPTLAKIASDGLVTVQPKKEGTCILTARTPEGLEAEIRLWVRDSAPRLESSRLTVNSYEMKPISTGLVEIYGNTVEAVSVQDYDAAQKAYLEEPSRIFGVAYEDGQLQLEALDVVKNGNYAVRLRVQTANTGFAYPLQIKVANSLPKVNVKQTEKFELFYLDSRAGLTVSAPGAEIDRVNLTDTEDFRLEEAENGWEIAYGEEYLPGTKADPKGTLQIFLDGYRVPVEKAITVATANTVPKLTVDPGSTAVDSAQEPIGICRVFQNGQALDLTEAEIAADSNFSEVTAQGRDLRFALTGTKGGTVNFALRLPNWTQAVKLSHKITVENKLPTLKLQSGTLKLNRRFPWQTGETAAFLTQSNQTLGTVTFVSTAREGTAQRTDADKIALSFAPDGRIQASFRDEQDLPKNGNYTFACKGCLADGRELPAVNLKVTVADTAPKAKLSAGSVRLNRYLARKERARVIVTLSDPAYRVAGFQEDYEELSYEDGTLTVCLTESSKNASFLLTPIVEDVETGQTAVLPDHLKLGLTVYDSPKLGISLSAKGKLDTLVPESSISYTVNKLTNCQGAIEDMALEGPDADKFRLEPDTAGAKPVGKLMLLEDAVYDTKQVYQVQFAFALCGEKILSPVQKIRVSQGNLKVTVPKTCNLYLGQKAPLRCTLAPSAPVETVAISYKTDKTFLEALGTADNFEVNGNQVLFHMAAPEKLKAGKSYAVYLDLTPEHNAVNVKPTQVKLTVKAVK